MPKIVDHRKKLQAGHEFFIRPEGYHKRYQLIELKTGLFKMKSNDTTIPDCYVFIEVGKFTRVYTGSGLAIMQSVPFNEILFIHP